MRPPVRDPLARRKNVLLRGEQDVIDAADRIARRFRISRNEALNAMLREFINGEPDPACGSQGTCRRQRPPPRRRLSRRSAGRSPSRGRGPRRPTSPGRTARDRPGHYRPDR